MAGQAKPAVEKHAIPPASEPLNVVETPTSPSSAFALSRFEFEEGKGNDGTKILMVEWDASAVAPDPSSGAESVSDGADWEVSWEGKTVALPTQDTEAGSDAEGKANRRLYFLLPPGAPIPTIVSISRKGADSNSRSTVLRTKPMPAIFPKELTGDSRETVGKRGVLHTVWAKRRLADLQAEIAAEMRTNGESVGLEMAMQERQWIVDHFGLPPADGVPQPTRLHIPQQPAQGPASPRSPIGGRLGEKLRGLKLATSPVELAAAAQAARATPREPRPQITSLSPAASDTVVAKDGVVSLNAVLGAGAPIGAATTGAGAADPDAEEDLFALPMSPRSPEMKRSPFSIL